MISGTYDKLTTIADVYLKNLTS